MGRSRFQVLLDLYRPSFRVYELLVGGTNVTCHFKAFSFGFLGLIEFGVEDF